ncbi:MAG: YncE family protein [Chloroflexi bacterium]|nr:MAG: YncE family protein [Chloroflexota bacterium]
MRRLTGLVLVGVLAFTFVGSPASRAATVASSWPVGPQPFGLAVDEQTGKVYVANSGGAAPDGSGRISVVDPATGSVDTIRTSLTPNLVLVDSVGRRLYSSNANLNTNARSLDVFDLDTRASVANLPVGGFGMALDRAAGRLYVCESGSLKVIDTTTLAVVASATAPASTWWFSVAADPDRHHLYVTNIRETSPTFFVLDDRDLTTLAEIPFATATRFAVTVDPVTHFVFVAGGQWDGQAMASALSVIDPDTLNVTQRTSLPGFAVGIALAPSRHRIYVSDNTGYRLYGIDDTTLGIAETMRLEFPPGELLMHPDRRLYVGNHNTSSQSASTLAALDLNNHAPVFLSLSLTPSIAFTGDTLRADARAYDPDLAPTIAGNPVSYTYEWSRNGNVLPGAGSPSLDLSVPGTGDRGDTISVRVTASDGELVSVASTSVVITDSAPTAAVSLSDSAPATKAVLSARAVASDADNDPVTYRFVWKVNGVVRQTTPGPNDSDSFDLAVVGNGDHGDRVVVELVASDGTLQSGVASDAATVVNTAPTVAVSLSTTTPTSKSVLIATVVGQDLDSDGLTYVYTWRLNGVVMRTVTTTSTTDRYDLSVRGNGDKGDIVSVMVTATDGSLTSPSASISAMVRSH